MEVAPRVLQHVVRCGTGRWIAAPIQELISLPLAPPML